MNRIQDLLTAIKVGEDSDWEFKSAKGGLPKSLWESYVGMANTDGGNIVLGVEDDGFVSGLADPQKMQTNFWNTVNNRGHVSVNLLNDQCVRVETIDSKNVMVISVPRADRRQRPVFLSPNPVNGTFRRNFEGDYHGSEEEVRRMLADQSDMPADSRILKNFGIDDLHQESLQAYRNRFSAVKPQHPWLELDQIGLLTKLGGWRSDRDKDEHGLTVAGLLMFGNDEAIRDPAAIPQYHIDYREKLSDDPAVRWTDRLTIDGTWIGNLYQFYWQVVKRLTVDLKVPFQLQPNLIRKDDTIVHEAVRESLVNAIIHADYRGLGGIVVENYGNRFELSNPGSLLLSHDQLLTGGVSECRNKSLQKMFQIIGGGEQLGSGIDKIWSGWASQHWRTPRISERARPDRVKLVLPMTSLLPDEAIERLARVLGTKFTQATELERLAIVTADLEGEVSNARIREMSEQHAADITLALQGLVGKKLLAQQGNKRGTSYRLAVDTSSPHKGSNSDDLSPNSTHLSSDSTHLDPNSNDLSSNSPHNEPNSTDLTASSPHNDPSLPHNDLSLPHNDLSSPQQAATDPVLLAISEPARKKKRLPINQTNQIILALCERRYLTRQEIGQLMNRDPKNLTDRFISPLVKAGKLTPRYEDSTNPKQAYTSAEE